MAERVNNMDDSISKRVESHVQRELPSLKAHIDESSRSWFWPFVLFVAVALAIGFYYNQRIAKLYKASHLP